MNKNIVRIIEQITNPDGLSCSLCPNLKNKPENFGCGLNECMTQVHKLVEREMLG